MDQPYSVVADWLSKFHAWPELIQTLWLVAIPVTVLGVTWLTMRGVTGIVSILARRCWRGHLIYGIYQDEDGRWMLHRHGHPPQAIDGSHPPDLIGRAAVVQGVSGGRGSRPASHPLPVFPRRRGSRPTTFRGRARRRPGDSFCIGGSYGSRALAPLAPEWTA